MLSHKDGLHHYLLFGELFFLAHYFNHKIHNHQNTLPFPPHLLKSLNDDIGKSVKKNTMKADTLKFLDGFNDDDGGTVRAIGGQGSVTEGNGKIGKILCVPLEKSPISLKYHLTHCLKKPNSNILDDFYDFAFISLPLSLLSFYFCHFCYISAFSQRQSTS